MTQSISSQLPGHESPVIAAVQEAVTQAKALGITWTIRMATVVTDLPLTIVYDGDTTVVNGVSIIGPLDPNQRVYVLVIPPSGTFVIGSTETTLSRGFLGSNSTTNGTVCTTPAGGAETAVPSAQWLVEPIFDFLSGRIYKATLTGFAIESTGAGGAVSLIRLRKGSQTTVGTQLTLKEMFHPAGFGALTQSFSYIGFFKNTSGATVSTPLSLSINGVIGAGTWSLYGDANDALKVSIEDVAWAGDNTTFANTLISV